MPQVSVGQPAPPFRLPSGQGPSIGLEDYRDRKNLIVWFTKGMACPFCRSHMSQLVRGYPEFHRLGTEILEVAPTPPARARFYVEKFPLPFPYLCDPDYGVRRAWTEDGVRSHSPLWYANTFMLAIRSTPPPSDFGDVKITAREFGQMMVDDDTGFFIIDRKGVVRYSLAATYVDYERGAPRPIPSNAEILRELESCQTS